MPPALQAHYANRIGRNDVVQVAGRMQVRQSPLMRPFNVLFRWTKTLVPITAKDVNTQVTFRTRSNSRAFWYERRFNLPDGQWIEFVSRMEPQDSGEVIEWTGAGVGWLSRFSFDGHRVHLAHRGYRLRMGSVTLPLPVTWLFGTPAAWEEAISATEFRMKMTIDHPIFGQVYAYEGEFRLGDITLEE